MQQNVGCDHRYVITAKSVYASIDPKHKTLRSDDHTYLYDEVVYCNKPTCERVFRATLHKPLETWRDRTHPLSGE